VKLELIFESLKRRELNGDVLLRIGKTSKNKIIRFNE
jgi:hypothetical protein